MNNEERIAGAREALSTHRALGWDNGDKKDDLVDLLSNLMHWARFAGVKFGDALRIAEMHYDEESDGHEED